MSHPKIWRNGNVHVGSVGNSHLLAPALHYGLGVFEGIRSYQTARGPAIFRLGEHLDRMAQGAQALGMPFDREEMGQGCVEILRASGLGDAYLRPLAFYATGNLGLDVDRHGLETVVAAIPWQSHLGESAATKGVRAHRSHLLRNPASAIPPLKLCGGYVNSILAKRAATAAGFEEAVFVDAEGFVVEATGENLFMVSGGRITALEHPDALPGITRRTVMEMAGADTRKVPLEELLEADEVFLTGTSAELTPLGELAGRTWKPGRVTLGLREHYFDIVRGRNAAHSNWLTPLEDRS